MRLRITIHAAREMAADDISTGDIEAVLRTGEAIETYPEDTIRVLAEQGLEGIWLP